MRGFWALAANALEHGLISPTSSQVLALLLYFLQMAVEVGFPRVFTTSETQQCKALKVDASINK